MREYQLCLGDCLDVLLNIQDKSVDLVFTSPPYFNARKYSTFDTYETYLLFIEKFMQQVHRVLSLDGFFIFNTSPVIVPRVSRSHESKRLPIPFDTHFIAKNIGFKYIDDIIWEKPDGASSRAVKFSHHRRPMAYKPFTVTEYLFVFRKSDAPLIDKGIRKHTSQEIKASLIEDGYERTNVWRICPTRSNVHPATFPEELAKKVVSYYSFVNDCVLDPFAGTGTTGVAALKLGRKFIGIEKEPKYFAVADQRIQDTMKEIEHARLD